MIVNILNQPLIINNRDSYFLEKKMDKKNVYFGENEFKNRCAKSIIR